MSLEQRTLERIAKEFSALDQAPVIELLSSYAGPVHFGVPTGSTAGELTITWADETTSKSSDLAGGKATVGQK